MPKSISFWDHPVEKLEEALSIRKQIAALQSKLKSIFGSDEEGEAPTAKAKAPSKSGKRTMSPEARERIASAQRARWAKSKGATAEAKPAAKPGKTKRTMSPEARAKIAAAARKRWAGIKGEKPASTVPAKVSKPAKKAKRNISPEGRAAMAAAAKKRWAGVKKAGQ